MESKITKLPEDVTTLLEDGKMLLFIIQTCPYCHEAMRLLNSKGVEYEWIACDKLGITENQRNQFLKLTGARSYPRIFIGKTCIGGCDDLRSLEVTEKLDSMLAQNKIKVKGTSKL